MAAEVVVAAMEEVAMAAVVAMAAMMVVMATAMMAMVSMNSTRLALSSIRYKLACAYSKGINQSTQSESLGPWHARMQEIFSGEGGPGPTAGKQSECFFGFF